MSYIRAIEGNGIYIFPEDNGVKFMWFPDHMGEVFPDDMLDILLLKMDDEELARRRKHGSILLKAIQEDDEKFYKENKNFWKEGRQW